MSDFGLNFRNTSGFVTDPANTTYILETENYPTTRGGFTFGITAGTVNSANRNSGIDARLAGMHYSGGSSVKPEYRLDLSAGNYDIQCILGDATYTHSTQVEVLNDTASLFTISGTTTGGNRFFDALGVQHDTSWVPSSVEAKTNQSVSSGTLRWKVGDGISPNTGHIAHLRVTTTVAATPLGFGKITSNRQYFLPSEAALVLAALDNKRRLSRRRFFQWLPGAFWRK